MTSLLPDMRPFISSSDKAFFSRHFKKYHELFADFFASVYFGSPTTMEASSHFSPERGFEVSTPTRSFNAYFYFAPTRRELWEECALAGRSNKEVFELFLHAIYQSAKWEVEEEISIISQKEDIIAKLYLNARKACL